MSGATPDGYALSLAPHMRPRLADLLERARSCAQQGAPAPCLAEAVLEDTGPGGVDGGSPRWQKSWRDLELSLANVLGDLVARNRRESEALRERVLRDAEVAAEAALTRRLSAMADEHAPSAARLDAGAGQEPAPVAMLAPH